MRSRARTLVAILAATLIASVSRAQEVAPPVPASPSSMKSAVPPVLLTDPAIPYPQGATGDATIVLRIVVNSDGTVRSATPDEFNEPFSSDAANVALGWRFEPATKDGKPVAAKVRFEVVFHAPAPPTPPPTVLDADTASDRNRGSAPSKARPPPTKVDEVTVRGEHGEPSRTATLSRTEVREIPGTFGDPFRAIEIMPGVTPIISGLPFFFIRGAPPGDVGYFLDGIRVPYLFHVGAGPSVIHPGLIDTVDLYPGGYPARFGRFSGGIVSGETVPPRPEAHGEYNVRLFDAGALVETPFADERGTVMLGGRYSYTGLLFSLLSPDTSLDYWDYQARATYRMTPRDSVSVFTFGAYDFLGQRTATGTMTLFGASFYRLDVREDHRIDSNGTLRTAVTGGIDNTDLGDGRFLRDRLVGTRTEIKYRLSPDAMLRAGTDMQTDRYDIVLNTGTLSPADAGVANLFPSRTDLTMGARADVVLETGPLLEITPGLRLDFYTSEGAAAIGVDPRLATRTLLNKRTHLLTALGLAHQPPAFIVPVPGFQPGGLNGGLQMAVQESTGIEVELGRGATGTATVFHNGFFNMSDALSVMQPQLSGCAPGTFPTDSIGGDRGTQPSGGGSGCGVPRFTPGTVGSDRSGGGGQAAQSSGDVKQAQAFEARANGTAYGLELFLKKKLTDRVGGFVSYTLSRSTRTANNQDFIASFDRTHVVNAALAFDMGRRWRAGTRVTFYTGLPKAPDPTDPGSTRLDPFFRLDLRLEKRWELGKHWWISFVAEWMNATLSKESIGTSCTLSGCQETKIGPVTIPSIGLEGGF